MTCTAAEPGTAYFELVHRFPLRPIRTDAGLDEALAIIDHPSMNACKSLAVP
jgi:hypothetical protein